MGRRDDIEASGAELPAADRPEDSDTDRLLVRAQSGDKEAFAALYRRYFDRVYTYLRLLALDVHEAEDIAQQAFLDAMRALPNYEHRGRPFRAWLFTIVANRATSHFRKMGRVDPTEPAHLERHRERNGATAELGLDPLNWINDRDLMLFIERLPLVQRQVLLLRFLLDLPSAEIAKVLDRGPGDVRRLQHDALAFLRARLAAVGRVARSGERREWRRRITQVGVLRERRHALR